MQMLLIILFIQCMFIFIIIIYLVGFIYTNIYNNRTNMQLTSTVTKFDISICVSCSRPNSFTHCLHTAYTGRPTAFHLGLFIRMDFSGESIGGTHYHILGFPMKPLGFQNFPGDGPPTVECFFVKFKTPQSVKIYIRPWTSRECHYKIQGDTSSELYRIYYRVRVNWIMICLRDLFERQIIIITRWCRSYQQTSKTAYNIATRCR